MGTWGPGIFDDDVAADVRDDYKAELEAGAAPAEAAQTVLDRYGPEVNDPDEGPVIWLALAAVQAEAGAVDPAIAKRALEVIDRGEGMARWKESPEGQQQLAARQAALQELRRKLAGKAGAAATGGAAGPAAGAPPPPP